MSTAYLKERYLKEAEKKEFQEIADSPTLKYYTNWGIFKKRMNAPDSKTYIEIPDWVKGLSDKMVILSDKVVVKGVPEDHVEVHDEYNVVKDLQVDGKMEYYATARLTKAVEINIPSEEKVEGLVVVSLGGDGFTGHHVHLNLGSLSEAEIILVDLGGVWDTSIKTLTLAGELKSDSRLKVYSASIHGGSATYSRRVYRLSPRSRLELYTLYSSGASTRINEDVHLLGDYSEVEIASSGVSTPHSWGDVLLNVRHKGKRTKSYINGRGVVFEDGFLTMRGVAIVEEEAEWSSTHVEVHVSSLGETAKGNASPMLEIHTGNVEEAFHSASVSSLSEEELFYLQSRGLSKIDARNLLTEGTLYYSGVMDKLSIPVKQILTPFNS